MKNNKISIEKMFLIISIIFGLLLVFIVPPFQSPDEDSHFLKSYLISKGDILPEKNEKEVGYYIPENLENYIRDKQTMMGDFDKKYSYTDMYYEELLEFSYKNKIFKDISTSRITPIAHIVPAIGTFIGNRMSSFNNNSEKVGPIVLLQFARILCLIVYTIIGYYAIKISPKYKKTLFTILLLPSSLFLRSVVTYDSLLLVITALVFAKMLQIYCDKDYKFKKSDSVLFIMTGYILLNIKVVYSIVFVLMLFIPNKRFATKKNKYKSFAIMILSVLVLTLITKLCYINLPENSVELVNKQKEFMINNPIKYLKIFMHNFISQGKIQSYWMVGTFGLLDTYNSPVIIFITYINIIVVMLYEILTEKLELKIGINIMYFIFIFLSIFGIYSIMYLSWTPQVLGKAGGNEITGVQGRYFLPYLIMLPFIFSNKYINKLGDKLKKWLKKCTYFEDLYYVIPLGLIVISIFTIIIRFYI